MLLTITTGLPGAGKTTYARAWVAADPDRRARVNRDDLRAMLFDTHGQLSAEREDAVTAAERAAVVSLLEAGMDVVVDATHLTADSRAVWAELAASLGADFVVHAVDTPVAECIRRDAARGAQGCRSVGADVITALDDVRRRDAALSSLDHDDALPVRLPEPGGTGFR